MNKWLLFIYMVAVGSLLYVKWFEPSEITDGEGYWWFVFVICLILVIQELSKGLLDWLTDMKKKRETMKKSND